VRIALAVLLQHITTQHNTASLTGVKFQLVRYGEYSDNDAMKNFVSLPDGSLVNVNSIAYMEMTTLPSESGGDVEQCLRVVMLNLSNGDPGPRSIQAHLKPEQAKQFLGELTKAGVDVARLKKALKPLRKDLVNMMKKAARREG
jgi:hypothetical protein